jgi:hypothetical protein
MLTGLEIEYDANSYSFQYKQNFHEIVASVAQCLGKQLTHFVLNSKVEMKRISGTNQLEDSTANILEATQ